MFMVEKCVSVVDYSEKRKILSYFHTMNKVCENQVLQLLAITRRLEFSVMGEKSRNIQSLYESDFQIR